MLTKIDKVNALWNSITFVITSLLGFINFTLNYRSFSNIEFGLFILINSIFGIGYSLDFGFGVSTIKHISEARKNNDSKLLNEIFISFFAFFLIIAIVLVFVYVIYYYLFFSKTDFFINNDQYKINVVYFLLTISFFFKYLNNYLNRVFEGYAEFVLIGKINLVLAVSYFFTVLIIFIFKLTIIYLAFFLLLNSFITIVVLSIFSLLKLPELKFKLSFFNWRLLKKYAAYSINLQLAFLIGGFIDPIIKFLIGNFLSLSYVTFFETAKKIIDLSNGLIFSAQKGMFNKLSESNAVGKLKDFINNEIYIYSKMANYYSILIYGIINPLIFYFTFLWFKSLDSSIILLILFIPYSLISFGGCLYSVLMVEGKGIKLLFIQLSNIILIPVLLYLSLFFTKSYFGLIGYYVAILLSTVIMFIILIKYYGFDIKPYFRKVKMNKLIILNIILLMQVSLIMIYQNFFQYILIAFFIFYCIIFFDFLLYFYNLVTQKIKSFVLKT